MKFLQSSILFMLFFIVSSFKASAVEINVNETISDDNGCVWHITGTVDVSILTLTINSWDINMSGPCGNYDFHGGVAPGSGSNGGTTGYNMHAIAIPPTTAMLSQETQLYVLQFLIQYTQNYNY